MALTKIKPGVKYNIMVDATEVTIQYRLSYQGTPTPPAIYYEDPPIERIPASFPDEYQNSNNPEILTGRKCGNCIFFEAESGNCSKWNAIARDYYWCPSWDTMEPVIAQPNMFTPLINQTSDSDDNFSKFF